MAKKIKLFGEPGQVEDELTLLPDADIFADGKPGNDIIVDVNAGDDRAKGGAGDDLITYWHETNVGGTNRYEGGSGIDTLRLEFTEAEWLALNPDLQADLTRLLDFIADHTNPTGQVTGQWFDFTALDLTIKQFENVELIVGGDPLNPADEGVIAYDDSFDIGENENLVGANVLAANGLAADSVPDLVSSVALDGPGPGAGTLVFNNDGTFSFDPGTDFDYLADGESTSIGFDYKVTDANGDFDTATATINIMGENDPPVALDDDGTVSEDGPGIIIDLLANDSDADASDVLSIDSFDFTGLQGTVMDNLDGTITYDPNGAFESLNDGDTATDTFSYTITDGNGGFDTAQVDVTVEGVTDQQLVTIEFDGPFPDGQFPRSYTEDGFVFTAPNHLHMFTFFGPDPDVELLLHTGPSSPVRIEREGGGTFSLEQLTIEGFFGPPAATFSSNLGGFLFVTSAGVVNFGTLFEEVDWVDMASGPGNNLVVDEVMLA